MSTPPIACTLKPGDFQNRLDAWQALSDGWLMGREPISAGIRLIFAKAPGVAEAAAELLRLEAGCCPWMQSQLRPDGQRLLMDLTGNDPEAAKAVVALFGPPKA
ncbi:MAG: hypothetical protein M3075_06370 [Candidatus Dormibacteraeota bacterium]|nr:hypothetical protein [Candidatus Dormibacteraeota bacterium]